MKNPLSYSAYQKFTTCPHLYKLHYIDRLRPVSQPSSLAFGKAIDAGINALLLENGSPMEAADTELKRLVIEPIDWHRNDYDGEIIDEKTKAVLLEKCIELGYSGDSVDGLVASLFDRDRSLLSDKQKAAFALCCATSLRAKAELMLKAYKEKVCPLLKRTESVQKEENWKDKAGNEFVGVLDLLGDLGSGLAVIDNKTASRPYEKDAVKTSPQLALYSGVKGITQAAFIVLDKNVRKNRIKTCSLCGNVSTGRHKTCDKQVPSPYDAGDDGGPIYIRCSGEWTETIRPEINIQILVDEVPERVREITREAMSEAAKAIKTGCFPRNLNACGKMYGKPCPYIKLCWENDSSGLEKKEEAEK